MNRNLFAGMSRMEFNTDALPLSDEPVVVLKKDKEMYDLRKENILLKMKLVRITVVLEDMTKIIEKTKDTIMKQLIQPPNNFPNE